MASIARDATSLGPSRGGSLWLRRAWSSKQQHWNTRYVPDGTGNAAVDEIGEESVAVRGHCDEIAILALRRRRDLRRRIAAREQGLRREAVRRQPLGQPFDVIAVGSHLLRLAKVQMPDVARRPSVGDVNEHDRRPAIARQLLHVIENALVVTGVLDRN